MVEVLWKDAQLCLSLAAQEQQSSSWSRSAELCLEIMEICDDRLDVHKQMALLRTAAAATDVTEQFA